MDHLVNCVSVRGPPRLSRSNGAPGEKKIQFIPQNDFRTTIFSQLQNTISFLSDWKRKIEKAHWWSTYHRLRTAVLDKLSVLRQCWVFIIPLFTVDYSSFFWYWLKREYVQIIYSVAIWLIKLIMLHVFCASLWLLLILKLWVFENKVQALIR